MKKLLIIFSLLFFCYDNYAQVAVIKDNDGFTNVRKLPEKNSEIIYKLKDSEVFSYLEPENETEPEPEWIKVYVSKNKYQLECDTKDTFIGYIHKSRLNPIENLTKYNGTEFSFRYKLQDFNIENKITNLYGKFLTEINGRRFYGTDGGIPKTEVIGIEASVNGIEIDVHEIFYSDIFECNNDFVINKNKGDYIVHQWNSDGAGGYLIVWVFSNKKLKQRLILIP